MDAEQLPADWLKLIAVSRQLANAPDATSSLLIEHLESDVDKGKVISRQQAWVNKYARCTARGLIETPFKIRRNRTADGGYDIEAARELTADIEQAMVSWPEELD